MKFVFADTFYWLAIARPNDPYRERSLAARSNLAGAMIVMSDEVLTEFLNFISGRGPALREAAVKIVLAVSRDVNTRVIPQTRDTFMQALELYGKRLDKGYSLVDCSSMMIMNAKGITDVLTNDHHFTQEGFNILIKQ